MLTWLDIRAEDVALSAFPLFHIAGLALGGFTLTQGITQICVPNPRISHFLINALKTVPPTFVVNVPTVYFELLKKPEFRALDLKGHLKWCLSAAAPFPPENIKEFESIIGEGNFIELYGMTETSPVTAVNPALWKEETGIDRYAILGTLQAGGSGNRQSCRNWENQARCDIRGPQIMPGVL